MENIKEVQIGSQIWMAENLNVSELSNGDVIKEAQSDLDWAECDANGVPAWCYYDKDDGKGAKYGKLYNQFVLNVEFKIMKGWRLPSNSDWKQLAEFLGGESVAGLSSKSKKGWKNNGNGTNDSGFNVLPVGGRFDNQIFMGEKQRAHFWSSPITKDGSFPFVFVMFAIDSLRFQSAISRGYSIRLIKEV